MPQLHFSVDEPTARRVREDAKARGETVSSYLAGLLSERLPDRWPDGYLQQVVGCCAEEPLEEPEDLELREVSL
jgi:hypothetical protein